MKAMVLEKLAEPMPVREYPDPLCPEHGAVVSLEASGICRSDWHLWMGDWDWIGIRPMLPTIIGHEYAGIVREVGRGVRTRKPGDRVIVPVVHACGVCEDCSRGDSNLCYRAGEGFGGYGRYAAVGYADFNLVPLSNAISFVEAAAMGCRYITAYHGILDQGRVRADESVVVYGCGGVGLSAIQIAAAAGASVIAVDLDDRKLALARKVGAEHLLNARQTKPVDAVMDLTHGGADVSVDALGIPDTCRNSLLSLRKRGRQVQIGLTTQQEKGEVCLPLDRIVVKELQLIGSTSMPAWRYPALLAMVERGTLSPKDLVIQTIPIERAFGVIEQMSEFENVGLTVIDQF